MHQNRTGQRVIGAGLPKSEVRAFNEVVLGAFGLFDSMRELLGADVAKVDDELFMVLDLARCARMASFLRSAGAERVGDYAATDLEQMVEECAPLLTDRQVLLFETYPVGLAQMPYEKYLWTRDWDDIRLVVLTLAGHACRICNSRQRLNVHHRSYERRGMEHYEDVTALCGDCHGRFHGAPV